MTYKGKTTLNSTNYRVKQNGLIVGTVTDTTMSGALRQAISEYGSDVILEEDVKDDLVEQEGTRDVRLMRSYKTKMLFVQRTDFEDAVNEWLSNLDAVIHHVQVFPTYEERVPHHYLTAIFTYSSPAETSAYKSVSERLLTNPNALKEVIAMLPDEKLFRFCSALGVKWCMYPDRDQTRRDCLNGIITELASPTDPQYAEEVKKARRNINTPLSQSDIDIIRARFVSTNVGMQSVGKGEHPEDLPTIEEWCDQIDYLLSLLAEYGISPK